MAQQGKQVALIYGSTTSGAVPAAATLHTSKSGVELALNAADGRLFFKNTSGEVQILADVNSVLGRGTAELISGTIDGVTIGGTTPAQGSFTSLSAEVLKLTVTGILKSTASGVDAAVANVDYVPGSSLGVADGVATLGGDGKVPLSQLPAQVANGMRYLGVWNAATNDPPITSSSGNLGDFYKVQVEGTTEIDGEDNWQVGDTIAFDGTTWARIEGTVVSVTSVNGSTGNVIITAQSLNAAASGSNNDITELSALATPLTVQQGGTGRLNLSGLLKGVGQDPVEVAIPGVDYLEPTTGNLTQILGPNGSGGLVNITIGSGLLLSGAVLSATGGGSTGTGTVTSVTASGGSTGLMFTGGPITTAGTLTLTGTLAVANGGTGKTTLSGILKGNGTSAISTAVAGTDYAAAPTGTDGQLLANNGVGGFNNITVGAGLNLSSGVLSSTAASSSGTVTSVNVAGGTTGLTFSGGPVTSSGIITMAGRLNVTAGGTGVSSITGILKGNGTAAFSAAVAGTDYAAPPTGASTQLLANNGAHGFTNVTVGSGLTYTGGVLSMTSLAGTGTVTSVSVSGGMTGLTVTNDTVTETGTISLDGVLDVAHGGTGAQSIDGLLMSNGAGPVTAAVSGFDYAPAVTGPAGRVLSGDGMGGFKYLQLGAGLAFTSDNKIRTTNGAVSVKDYGALGDGTTDDSDAIEAAVAAAQAINSAVYFPAGTYAIPTISTLSGRVFLVGDGDATISGSLVYYDGTFAPSAATNTPVTPTSPYFSAVGLNFSSVGSNTWALSVSAQEQGSFLSTASIRECRFFGAKGLTCDSLIGYEILHCEFNTRTSGLHMYGCVNGTVGYCRFQNQAECGVRIKERTGHGASGFDRLGGENIKFICCEWAVCTYGLYVENHMWLVLESCLIDYCCVPLVLFGSEYTKLGNTYFGAANNATMFSSVAGYIAPITSGVAMVAAPNQYRNLMISSHKCEFVNYVSGSTQPLVYVDKNYVTTSSLDAKQLVFNDNLFLAASTHLATTLCSIANAYGIRLTTNRFTSENVSTTLTSCWVCTSCTDYKGFANVFNATQSGVAVTTAQETVI